MSAQIKVGIAGVQGYVGQELMSLIKQHHLLEMAGILAKKSEQEVYAELPLLAEQNIPVFSVEEIQSYPLDILLLATPPETSMELVSILKKAPFKIIDLSGAFRLSEEEFHGWYGLTQKEPEILTITNYGLAPWGVKYNESKKIVANPGCYATAALMPLIPLIKHGILKNNNLIIDAKSGVSGAGKKANSDLMFNEMHQNFFPYKVGMHQHTPEIQKALTQFTNVSCELTFTTHMLPISRGISMSIYADAQNLGLSDKEIADSIETAYHSEYKNYPLIKFGEINQGNIQKDKFLLSLKSVVGTPKTHVAYYVKSGKVFLFSSIDNLLKGAASQAIENINALYNLPLETGLLLKEGVL